MRVLRACAVTSGAGAIGALQAGTFSGLAIEDTSGGQASLAFAYGNATGNSYLKPTHTLSIDVDAGLMAGDALLFSLEAVTEEALDSSVHFMVDMSCYRRGFERIRVACDACGADGLELMESVPGSRIFHATLASVESGASVEYQYMLDGGVAEDLLEAARGGEGCAPVSDFYSFARRRVRVWGATEVRDAFAQCSRCGAASAAVGGASTTNWCGLSGVLAALPLDVTVPA